MLQQQLDRDAMSHGGEIPEPYDQVIPGDKIQAGDIWRLLDNDTWQYVAPERVGLKVPDGDQIIARIHVPEGYQLLVSGNVLDARDLIWQKGQCGWKQLPGNHVGLKYVLLDKPLVDMVVCRPTFSPDTGRDLAIPGQHRPLAVGEKMRRGDKFVQRGQAMWNDCTAAMLGKNVPESNEANNYWRVCRPIHPAAGTWYVAVPPMKGRKEAVGSATDPFESLSVATETLENLMKETKKAVFGVIYDTKGKMLYAYDMVEPTIAKKVAPEAHPQPGENPVMTRPMQTLPVFEEHSVSWIAKERGKNNDDIISEAMSRIPIGWRSMTSDEVLQINDQRWMLLNKDGDCGWRQLPATLVGKPVNDYYVIRHTVSPALKAQIDKCHTHLTAANAAFQEIQQIIGKHPQ